MQCPRCPANHGHAVARVPWRLTLERPVLGYLDIWPLLAVVLLVLYIFLWTGFPLDSE